MNASNVIGILGAIPQEINGIINSLTSVKETVISNRSYYEGFLGEQKVVVVYSRIGKVAAAATVATLLLKFDVCKVVFIGVAGGIGRDVCVGDVVVAKDLIQYDMDASPLRPKFEVPLIGKSYFSSDQELSIAIVDRIKAILSPDNLNELIDSDDLKKFKIKAPKVLFGTIVSGDQFVSTNEQRSRLLAELPNALCVEMEGAAVAQVCFEFGIPCVVIRTISDNANHEASFSFQSFVEEVSIVYGREILKTIIELM